METQNYKRTIAGSVGAGMGALLNASGRTYFMLEHKTNTKYHKAGDTQKIIIDEIEMGRDSSCQVRFDETCETVSRKHAAIQRSGEDWKLIHLSTSNPTLVNGTPIQGEYILQNGDEIQLSVGGPRMGFIVPQGKQALTSSIGLTERMNLFRQQALAPYKRALWTMAILFVLVVAGLGYWNYRLGNELKAQKAEAVELKQQLNEYDEQIQELEQQAEKTPELIAKIEELKNLKAKTEIRYQTVYTGVKEKDPDAAAKIDNNQFDEVIDEPDPEPEPKPDQPKPDQPKPENPEPVVIGATDISEYTNFVYSLKIDNIKISYGGTDIKHNVANPGVIGNGFLIDNGNFVTARQNVQPWIYSGVLADGQWRQDLAEYFACGCDIEISYSAYSSDGTAKKLTFTSRDFHHPADYVESSIEIRKSIRNILRKSGFTIDYLTGYYRTYSQFASSSSCYAVISGLANDGIPTSSASIEGGKTIKIAGYEGNTDVHSLNSFRYLTSTTEYKDDANGTYILQDGSNTAGFLGSPAFIQEEDKSYKCVGVYVGNMFGRPRIVPINRCKNI